jgi:hypothetical protein
MNVILAENGLPDLLPHPESDVIDGITYDSQGRMQYNPSFHTNNGTSFTTEEIEYLCTYFHVCSRREMSYALGRTETSVITKYQILKKQGLIEHYKSEYLRKLNSL